MNCYNEKCFYFSKLMDSNCSYGDDTEYAEKCMRDCFCYFKPADLPEAGASAERISSVVRSNATTTTKYFWDCECEKNYIHSKHIAFCNKCKTRREHQPDSRINEVIEMMIAKG